MVSIGNEKAQEYEYYRQCWLSVAHEVAAGSSANGTKR